MGESEHKMSGGQHGPMAEVRLRCQNCGNETMIWRRKGRLKEPNHVKHLWCFKCRDRTAHVEVRD